MKATEFLSKETAGLPNWAWGAVIVAGIGATYLVPRLFGKSGSTAATAVDTGTSKANTSGIGLAVDPTSGLPYAVEGLVPSGGTSGTQTPPGTPSGSNLFQEIGIIRYRTSTGTTANYDQKNAQGVPIRSSAGGTGSIIGYEPYGTQITVTGPAVTGSSNFSGQPSGTGSLLWYPVQTSTGQTGYISGYDFTGTPSPRPVSWPYA